MAGGDCHQPFPYVPAVLKSRGKKDMGMSAELPLREAVCWCPHYVLREAVAVLKEIICGNI